MTNLRKIQISSGNKKKLAKKLKKKKKACKTRWLSFDKAVNVVKANYEGILLTLQELDESNDVTAGGFLKKMKTIKFIGVIYILSDILPVLSQLSKAFQKGTINFSQINP